MKKALWITALLFFILKLQSQIFWQFNKDSVTTWYYQEGDEFNQDSINTNYWKYVGSVRSLFPNKEQQYYTDGENHNLIDGALHLNARREAVENKVIDWIGENDSVFAGGKYYGINKRKFSFTSGYLETKKRFRYGYFEIKFKSPVQEGFWPAFWLYGGSPGEEIDFMELKTEKKNKIHVGRHSAKKEENYLPYRLRKRVWGDWVKFKGDLSSGFYVVSGEWTKNYIRYYLNGECIAHTQVRLDTSKNLILNLAVPSNGPFKPGPHDTVTSSGNFEIDYIRIWSKSETDVTSTKVEVSHNFPERKIEKSKLKSKNRFLYGSKKDHLGDGICVSFFETSKNEFQLTVLGLDIPLDSKYRLFNKKGEILFFGNLLYGETNFNLANTSSLEFTLEVVAYGAVKAFSFKN